MTGLILSLAILMLLTSIKSNPIDAIKSEVIFTAITETSATTLSTPTSESTSSSTSSTTPATKSQDEINKNKYQNLRVVNKAERFICADIGASILTQFYISDENTFDCYEETLFIVIAHSSSTNGETSELKAYLTPELGCISETAVTGKTCRRIRRFFSGFKTFNKLQIK